MGPAMVKDACEDKGGTRSGNDRRQERSSVSLNRRTGEDRRSGSDRRKIDGQRRFLERRDFLGNIRNPPNDYLPAFCISFYC